MLKLFVLPLRNVTASVHSNTTRSVGSRPRGAQTVFESVLELISSQPGDSVTSLGVHTRLLRSAGLLPPSHALSTQLC